MRIDFDEVVDADVGRVFDFMKSPQDWTRLYGSFGEVTDRGNGWMAVPLRGFPIPLVARVTTIVPSELVAWELRGFFTGTGEVRLAPRGAGAAVRGYEEVSIPRLLGLGRIIERRFLTPRFERLWASGWRRLRQPSAMSDG